MGDHPWRLTCPSLGAGGIRAVLRELDVEADPDDVFDLKEELPRRHDPKVAHFELALAPHPETMVAPPNAPGKAHGSIDAMNRHVAEDRSQHVRSLGHRRERGLDPL